MIGSSVDILILDAHGVVFNNPLPSFLKRLAAMTGQRGDDVLRRWHHELRMPAWTGGISDDEIWHRLTGGQGDPECWQSLLETCYALGPVGSRLSLLPKTLPIWILSNHRTTWLHRRLKRFGLLERFEQVIVSEDLCLAKPDLRLFQAVMNRVPESKQVLFIDDNSQNLAAASLAGMDAIHVAKLVMPRERKRDRSK